MFLFKKFFGIGSLRTGARFTAIIDVILGCFFIYLGVMCNNIFKNKNTEHMVFVSILSFINGILSLILSIFLIGSIYKQCTQNIYIWVMIKLFVLLCFPIISFILINKQINEDLSIGIIITTIFFFILLNVFVIYLWVCMFFYYHELRTEKRIAEHHKNDQKKNFDNNELTLVYINDKCVSDQKRASTSSSSNYVDEQQEVDIGAAHADVVKVAQNTKID